MISDAQPTTCKQIKAVGRRRTLWYFEVAATQSCAASGGCPKGFDGGQPSAVLWLLNDAVSHACVAVHMATRRSKRVESHYSDRLLALVLPGQLFNHRGYTPLNGAEKNTEFSKPYNVNSL